jgi:exonuclease SbcD
MLTPRRVVNEVLSEVEWIGRRCAASGTPAGAPPFRAEVTQRERAPPDVRPAAYGAAQMTVRLLHTSDWHLGQSLHDVDRTGEHREFLAWLAGLCERERIHALLVAGDVFDVSNPPAASVTLLAEFLVALWRRLERLQVIVVGGNHDSAHRLETTEPFLGALGRLHVLGALPRRDGAIDADRALVRVQGDGGASALVAAIPFLRAADLRADELEGDPATPVRRIHEELLGAARGRLRPGEPLVVMGHLFVSGGAASSERQLVGGVGAVPPDAFPPEVAYAALGHLHRPQAIGRLRYSGAPLPLSFDEAAHPQEVVRVELSPGALVLATGIPTPRTRPLLRIPEGDPGPLEEVLAALRALPARGDLAEDRLPLLEVRVRLERPEPGLRAQLDAALEGRAARLVSWRAAPTGSGAGLGDALPAAALADLDPIDVFRRRWASRHEGEPPAELLAAFDELLAEVRGEAVEPAPTGATAAVLT